MINFFVGRVEWDISLWTKVEVYESCLDLKLRWLKLDRHVWPDLFVCLFICFSFLFGRTIGHDFYLCQSSDMENVFLTYLK